VNPLSHTFGYFLISPALSAQAHKFKQFANMSTSIYKLALSLLLCLTTIFSSVAQSEQEVHVKIITDFGEMTVKLYNETPQHRDNFIKLVNEGFYDSLLFHRVISGFMVQGGDPKSKGAPAGSALGTGGLDYLVPAEFHQNLYHKKGALAAARQGDQMNPEKKSSACQFYIVQGKKSPPNILKSIEERKNKGEVRYKYPEQAFEDYNQIGGAPHLDGDYTVFGEVIEGLEVIDKIAAVEVDGRSRPLSDVVMKIERVN
jgi:cyclophilin family peptidyl-prolyl cis-trans isomerase